MLLVVRPGAPSSVLRCEEPQVAALLLVVRTGAPGRLVVWSGAPSSVLAPPSSVLAPVTSSIQMHLLHQNLLPSLCVFDLRSFSYSLYGAVCSYVAAQQRCECSKGSSWALRAWTPSKQHEAKFALLRRPKLNVGNTFLCRTLTHSRATHVCTALLLHECDTVPATQKVRDLSRDHAYKNKASKLPASRQNYALCHGLQGSRERPCFSRPGGSQPSPISAARPMVAALIEWRQLLL